MDRRSFVSRVTLGAAALCTSTASQSDAATAGGLKIHLIGMMGFVHRTDGSFLVATPGRQAHPGLDHRPFLMARRGSLLARALNLRPAFGVVPSAFDMRLAAERSENFVYRCLENTSLEVLSGPSVSVENRSRQMLQMAKIAPGKRLRGDIERWAPTTVSLQGGRLEDSAAHPDAGKVWTFGEFRQRLTDAVEFVGGPTATVRLTAGSEASRFDAGDDSAELWLISAAAASHDKAHDPRVLQHSEVVFDYLVDARPIVGECAEATGRDVPATELPCVHPSSASLGLPSAELRIPPVSDLCPPFELIRDLIW